MEVECIRRPCCEAYKEVEPALSRELRSERERVAQLLGSLPFGSVLAIFVLSACLAQSRMSPIAFRHTVICTRCSHLKRSRKLCFAVAIVPFAIGSASLPVESILAKNQIKNTPAEVDDTWRRRAKQGNTVHAHQNFRPTLSLSRATRITSTCVIHMPFFHLVRPVVRYRLIGGSPWCCQTPPPSTWRRWGIGIVACRRDGFQLSADRFDGHKVLETPATGFETV